MPFYVNRSKRHMDKAGGFAAGLAARLVELAQEAGDDGGGRSAHEGCADEAGARDEDGGERESPMELRCPELVAQLEGWALEVMCRVQAPQNELHVCVKLTEHPYLAAAAAAQHRKHTADVDCLAGADLASAIQSEAVAAPAVAAAGADCHLMSLQPSVGGSMAQLAGCRRGGGAVCVLINRSCGSGSVIDQSGFTPGALKTSGPPSSSVTLAAVLAAADCPAKGAKP